MPVRDAFLQLQSEGVLTSGGDGTAVVAATTQEEIHDMYQLASVASAIAARRACMRMSEQDLEELDAAQTGFIEAVRHEDTDTAFGSNNTFHRLVNIHSESPRLIALLRNISAGMPALGVREIPEWRGQAIHAHEELLDAFRLRDASRAAEVMEAHVLSAADVVIDHLSKSGLWDEVDV